LFLEALAHHVNSDLTQAKKSLSDAITIGQAKGFCRIFLDEGRRMATLLQAILPALTNRTLSLFATTLLHSFSPEMTSHLAANSFTVQIEALSHQELRVLRLLVAGLSNTDIAQELVVSTNTVKTHVKSIYRKLNITSRNEARQVARELKLV
jgi:ATP/maltotriose-dependent transcriptional regulator MalT